MADATRAPFDVPEPSQGPWRLKPTRDTVPLLSPVDPWAGMTTSIQRQLAPDKWEMIAVAGDDDMRFLFAAATAFKRGADRLGCNATWLAERMAENRFGVADIIETVAVIGKDFVKHGTEMVNAVDMLKNAPQRTKERT